MEQPSAGRDPQGRFAAGNAGGPGRRPGRSNEFRQAVEQAVSPDHVAAIMRRLVRKALEGDITASRLVLERMCGKPAESPTETRPPGATLPRLRTAADCAAATDRIIESISQGTDDPVATRLLMDAVQLRLRAIEATDLELRLAELEEAAKHTMGQHR